MTWKVEFPRAAEQQEQIMMTYKGYTAKAEFDDEAMVFSGEVVGIRDVITFQGKSVEELERAFHDSVDDYLDMTSVSTRG